MLTLNEVHRKIEEISSKYYSGTPRIHVRNLMDELNAPKEEIIQHLNELDTQGVITFHVSLHDIFSLSARQAGENNISFPAQTSRTE